MEVVPPSAPPAPPCWRADYGGGGPLCPPLPPLAGELTMEEVTRLFVVPNSQSGALSWVEALLSGAARLPSVSLSPAATHTASSATPTTLYRRLSGPMDPESEPDPGSGLGAVQQVARALEAPAGWDAVACVGREMVGSVRLGHYISYASIFTLDQVSGWGGRERGHGVGCASLFTLDQVCVCGWVGGALRRLRILVHPGPGVWALGAGSLCLCYCLAHCASATAWLTVPLLLPGSLCLCYCLAHCASATAWLTVHLLLPGSLCLRYCLGHATACLESFPRVQVAAMAVGHYQANLLLPDRDCLTACPGGGHGCGPQPGQPATALPLLPYRVSRWRPRLWATTRPTCYCLTATA